MRKKTRRNTITDPASPLYNESEHVMTCVSKKSYPTYWQAKYAADRFFEHRQIRLNIYQCPFCKQWHLTHDAT